MAAVEEAQEASPNEWCKLICTHEARPPIAVTKETFSFGRSPACDMSFVGCKFMSGNHCFIMRDSDGKAWLHDTSTNGTLVNGKKVKAGQAAKLHNNDEIKLVQRKDLPMGIGFMFHYSQTHSEEEALENTQEYDLDSDSEISSMDKKKSIKEEENTQKIGKRPYHKIDSTSETDSPTPKKQHVEIEEEVEESGIKELKKSQSSIAENLICSICQDIFHDCISLQPCMHSYCASCYSQWMDRSTGCPSCRLKVKRVSKNHLVNNLVEAFLKDHPEKRRSKEEIDEMNSKNKITSDMQRPHRRRHGLMSMFGGLLAFDDESDEDEEDDEEVSEEESDLSEYSLPDDDYDEDDDDDDNDDTYARLFGRHGSAADSIASLFGFASHGRSRTSSQVCRQCPSSIQPSSNPSTAPTSTASVSGTSVGGTSVGGTSVGGTSVGGTSVGGTSVGGTSVGGTIVGGTSVGGTSVGGTSVGGTSVGGTSVGGTSVGGTSVGGTSVGGTSVGGTSVGGTSVGGTSVGGTSVGGTSVGGTIVGGTSVGGTSVGGTIVSGTSASTSDTNANNSNTDSSSITCQSYVCSPSRSHILCLCCMEYMPDRRNSADNDSPQTCCVCNRAFCNMYWGRCPGRCHGCLSEFKNMTFQGSYFSDNLICNNTYESTILKDCMSDKSISFEELMQRCLEKLDSKEYRPKDSCDITSKTAVCQKCGFRNLQELAYQYRRDIPRAELPESVTNRTDCYWGRNCRTQKTSLHHARKFNHICEQTRFS